MSFSSNSVIAKARAIYGRSLKADDYAKLCAKGSVAEAAAFLRQTDRYADVLCDINPQTIHRGRLEALIRRSTFDIFERFHKFDHSNSRVFFKYIIMELEAEQVLTALESVAGGSADRYVAELPTFLLEHANTDLLELAKAENYMEFAHLIEGTPYSKILRPMLVDAQQTGRINIVECERRLYTFYYMSALKTADKTYKGSDRQILRRSLLKSIDMENVVSCCRMKTFGTAPDKIKASLLPFRYHLREDTIDRLIQLNDTEKIQAELEKLGYRISGTPELQSVEQLTETISMEHLRRTLRLSRNSAAVYYALIECLKIEQRNVKTAIEGIRYGLSSSDILNMLVI